MMRKKLGIMGGSFDPIHNGHLGIAKAIQNTLHLDEILFIPAYISPFKQWKEAAPGLDRYKMVELAIKDEASWSASNIELMRTGISYTYDTIVALKEQYGAVYDLFFIIGADSAVELTKWYRIQEALDLCTFVVAARPGFAHKAELVKKSLQASELTHLVWVQTPEIAISSTEIRNNIKENLPIEGLMPPAVVEYIRQRDLYQK